MGLILCFASLKYYSVTNFRECCMQVPELGKYMENGINIDPVPLTMDQFATAGDMDGRVSMQNLNEA